MGHLRGGGDRQRGEGLVLGAMGGLSPQLELKSAELKSARDLVEEDEQLLSKVAALSCRYASLMGKHASSERRAKSDSRQASQRERQLSSRLAAAEARVSAAEQRTAEAIDAEEQAEERALEAERAADAAEESVAEAQRAADEANAEAKAASADAEAARRESSDADYVRVILEAKLARAEASAAEKQAKLRTQRAELLKGPANRTVDEWAALGREAEYKAAQRERRYLSEFISSHDFRPKDIAASLDELNLVAAIFKEQPFFEQHFEHVQALVKRLEEEHFGESFGIFLHYEMNLTFEKILRLTQAASKKFDKGLNHYTSKVLLYNPHRKDQVVMVPRLAPPKHKLAVSKKTIESKLNVQSGEDGRVSPSFLSLTSSSSSSLETLATEGTEGELATACPLSATSWAASTSSHSSSSSTARASAQASSTPSRSTTRTPRSRRSRSTSSALAIARTIAAAPRAFWAPTSKLSTTWRVLLNAASWYLRARSRRSSS